MLKSDARVFRFAPSPNGYLHLGHALSAMLNHDAARACGGHFLLRIEDIDQGRARMEFERAIKEDLAWLGLAWEEPVRRQSRHFADYAAAFDRLKKAGHVFPCFCTRRAIQDDVAAREQAAGAAWPRDPDGAPLYPGRCRALPWAEAERRLRNERAAWRIDMERAIGAADPGLGFTEMTDDGGECLINAEPLVWGDVIIVRKDAPTSYHLSVSVDDAFQGVTDVIRGSDLRAATCVHRLLQALLDLPTPRYRHHRLVFGAEGAKLSKSANAPALRQLRADGVSPGEIRRRLGLTSQTR